MRKVVPSHEVEKMTGRHHRGRGHEAPIGAHNRTAVSEMARGRLFGLLLVLLEQLAAKQPLVLVIQGSALADRGAASVPGSQPAAGGCLGSRPARPRSGYRGW